MGLPAPIVLWTGSGNYPAGPDLWNGQPLAVAPPGTYFTPNTKAVAENMNYQLAQMTLETALLRGYVAPLAAQNWGIEWPVATLFGGSGYNLCAAWDPLASVWLVGGNTATAGTNKAEVYFGRGLDQDANWAELTGSNITTGVTGMALSYDPAILGTYFAAYVKDDGTNNGTVVVAVSSGGGSWTTSTTITVSSSSSDIQKLSFATIGTKVVLGLGNTATGSGNTANRLEIWNGSTWTIQVSGQTHVPEFFFASSGSLLMAFCSGTIAYVTTPDGVTWTQTGITLGLENNNCVGLCFTADAEGPCFLAAFYDSGSGRTYFYRCSADGGPGNWTASGAPLTPFQIADMTATGSLVVCTLADDGSGGGTGIVYSPDGGASWFFSQGNLTANAASSALGYIHPRIVTNGQGFLNVDSLWSRFSLMAGLPLPL
jgi:hypothetical protein